jgi:transcriptional regulator with XRE-family HTH domain
MKFGHKIKKIRHLRGLKQEEVAARLHITVNAYIKIEEGDKQIDIKMLELLGQILTISVADIREFDDKNTYAQTLNDYKNNKGCIINNYNSDEYTTVALLEKIIAQQKEEILFLRQQLTLRTT